MKWSEHKKRWENKGIFLGVLLALVVMLFFSCKAQGADTSTVGLSWDQSPATDYIVEYRVYSTTNLAGIGSANLSNPDNPPFSLASIPAVENTNIWQMITSVTNKTAAGGLIERTKVETRVPRKGSACFYVVTAVNMEGLESPFSLVGWHPALQPSYLDRNLVVQP